MKPKVLNREIDWDIIKDTQLDFIEGGSKAVYADYRYTATISDKAEKSEVKEDPRDAFLTALIMILAYN